MALTVTQIQAIFERQMDNDFPDVSDQTFIDWADFLNKFTWNKLYKIEPERFVSEQTINVTDGTASYSLPAGFKTVNFRYGGVYETNDNGELTDVRLIKTNPGASTYGAYISGDQANVVFTPKPATSRAYILRYVAKLSTLTLLADTTVIDEEFAEYAVQGMKKYYSEFDMDTFQESVSDQRFVRLLDDYFDNYKQDIDTINILDISPIY